MAPTDLTKSIQNKALVEFINDLADSDDGPRLHLLPPEHSCLCPNGLYLKIDHTFGGHMYYSVSRYPFGGGAYYGAGEITIVGNTIKLSIYIFYDSAKATSVHYFQFQDPNCFSELKETMILGAANVINQIVSRGSRGKPNAEVLRS